MTLDKTKRTLLGYLYQRKENRISRYVALPRPMHTLVVRFIDFKKKSERP